MKPLIKKRNQIRRLKINSSRSLSSIKQLKRIITFSSRWVFRMPEQIIKNKRTRPMFLDQLFSIRVLNNHTSHLMALRTCHNSNPRSHARNRWGFLDNNSTTKLATNHKSMIRQVKTSRNRNLLRLKLLQINSFRPPMEIKTNLIKTPEIMIAKRWKRYSSKSYRRIICTTSLAKETYLNNLIRSKD